MPDQTPSPLEPSITLNGKTHALPAGGGAGTPSVVELLASLGLAGQACAVEVNGELVPKRLHAQHAVRPGDTVEVVTLVGGG